MAKKIDGTTTTAAIVKKYETVIAAMTEDEKKTAIATQLEAADAGTKQVEFYRAKEAAVAQQKQAGILVIETARNDAKTQLQVLEQKWAAASVKGTWEIPQ